VADSGDVPTYDVYRPIIGSFSPIAQASRSLPGSGVMQFSFDVRLLGQSGRCFNVRQWPLDLPLDYRSPWWAAVGDQVRAAECSLSVYDPR
jgi:hypothetical protein